MNTRIIAAMTLLSNVACDPADDEESASVIQSMQRGEIEPGTAVRVTDVVVTGTGLVGFWVQDRVGGQYSGLWVELAPDWQTAAPEVVPGAAVDVEGIYLEYDMDGSWPDSVTEIVTTPDTVVVRGSADQPEPLEVAYEELVDPVRAEPWEGVVVQVEHEVTVASTDTGYGGWSVTDGSAILELQNSMYKPDPLQVGDAFAGLAGVLQYSFGAFKLEPRGPNDVVRR